MAKQTINVGTLANDGTGDPARTAFGKCNSNFDELYAGAGSQATTLTGDVTGTGTGSFVATIANNAVSNSKAAQMPANTIKGNNTGSTGNATDLTAAQTRGVLALPTVTVAGRLARYTDTAGAQGSTSGLFEDGSGNVGIGTTTPGYKLDVNGTFRSSGLWVDGSTNAYWGNGSSANAFGKLTWEPGYASIFATSGNTLKLGSGGAQGTIVIASGNVGIGTSSPVTSLDVNGPIKAKSYTVATLPAAATVGAGTMAYVTDALTAWAVAAGGTVTGGGANFSRVVSDATNWKQM